MVTCQLLRIGGKLTRYVANNPNQSAWVKINLNLRRSLWATFEPKFNRKEIRSRESKSAFIKEEGKEEILPMKQRDELNTNWKNKWVDGRTNWHIDQVNPHLKEYFYRLNDGHLTGKRILVPLCGKSLDLKWLHDHGMCVVGVDIVELAVKAFFTENGFKFEIESSDRAPSCKIYRHDERLSIYVCDIFDLDSILLDGKFDYLWDRGALVAMIYDEHQKYWRTIDALLAPKAQGLIECYEYDRSLHPGPPHSITRKDLLKIIGKKYEAEQLFCRSNEQLPEGYTFYNDFENYRTLYYIKAKYDD